MMKSYIQCTNIRKNSGKRNEVYVKINIAAAHLQAASCLKSMRKAVYSSRTDGLHINLSYLLLSFFFSRIGGASRSLSPVSHLRITVRV